MPYNVHFFKDAFFYPPFSCYSRGQQIEELTIHFSCIRIEDRQSIRKVTIG